MLKIHILKIKYLTFKELWWLIFNLHCYLVFSSLKSIDLVCMKKLDTKVNVIPIIAKADTISKSELQKFKVNYIILI